MGGAIPTRPGWYRDPQGPRSFRYWDGRYWTGRARPQPPWAAQGASFELSYEDGDRSIEGPVHSRELREPVASGASSREWLAWRPRQAGAAWHRTPALSQAPRPPRVVAPPKLSPSRRPLLALMCLLVVAVGVVVSSVAFISPYETKPTVQAKEEVVAARFASGVNKQCAVVLPRYRGALAWGDDGPTIEAAARRVDLLSREIGSMAAPAAERGPLEEWLSMLQQFSSDQSRYGTIIGSATRLSGGRLIARPLSPAEQVQAAQMRQQATQLAARADTVSATLQLGACRLEPVPAS